MTGFAFPPGFLWGTATAPHQVEGGNVNSDWWAREERVPGMQLSGDACDSIATGDDARRVAYTRAALAWLGGIARAGKES